MVWSLSRADPWRSSRVPDPARPGVAVAGKHLPDRRPPDRLAAASGYALALFALRLFPRLHTAVLLAAAAAGPAWITSGMWLNSVYASSWLLVLLGFCVLTGQDAGAETSSIRSFTAGVLVGLGIYQHGSAALLAAALGVLMITTRGVRSRLAWLARTRRRARCGPHRRGTRSSRPNPSCTRPCPPRRSTSRSTSRRWGSAFGRTLGL